MSRFPTSFTRVRGLLADEQGLAVLLPEARRLAELNRRFGRAVPAGVARACRVASVQGGTVVVFCSHGAAASRLRSQATTLLKALSGREGGLATLQVKVRADWSLPIRPEKPGMRSSGVRAWSELSDALPDGELKSAVERLLRHQRHGG